MKFFTIVLWNCLLYARDGRAGEKEDVKGTSLFVSMIKDAGGRCEERAWVEGEEAEKTAEREMGRWKTTSGKSPKMGKEVWGK